MFSPWNNHQIHLAVRGRDKEKNGIRRNLWQVMLPSKDVFGLGNGGILQHF